MARLRHLDAESLPASLVGKLEYYDFILSHEDLGSCGFRVDWGNTTVPPAQVIREAQGAEGGSDKTEGDELYSSRDLSDALRIIYRDFGGGAGQVTRDVSSYAPHKFFHSRNIDISDPVGLRLQPGVSLINLPGLLGATCEFKGLLAFTVAKGETAGDRKQVAFLDPQDGSISYASGISDNYEAVSLATDGQYVYAALAGAGGIWRGTESGSWSQYSASATGISYLCYCSGYLYAVQGQVAGYLTGAGAFEAIAPLGALAPERTTFGLTEVGSWVYWGVTAGARSWVYALQYDPSGQVTENFEQYVELPTGFIGTSLEGYLNDLFIAGYRTSRHANTGQGAVYVATANGIARLCTVGDDPNRLSDSDPALGDASYDNRIRGIAGYDHELWIATSSALFVWDLRIGGLAHVADIGTYVSSEELINYAPTWTEDGLAHYTVSDEVMALPSGHMGSDETGYVEGAWAPLPEADDHFWSFQDSPLDPDTFFSAAVQRVTANATSPWGFSDAVDRSFSLRCYPKSTKPWREAIAWHFSEDHFVTGELFSNVSGSTLEVTTERLFGRCAEIGIRDGVRELAVRLKGSFVSTEDTWRLQVGEWNGSTYNFWNSAALLNRKREHVIRLTLRGERGRVYVDGVLLYETMATKPLVVAASGRCFYFSGGWCYNPIGPETDNYDKAWVVDFYEVRFSLAGAHDPTVSVPRSVGTTTNFTVLAGAPYLPAVSGGEDGLFSLDRSLYSRVPGQLTTSWSTSRMPGVLKHFSYVDVAHDPLREGEWISIIVESEQGRVVKTLTAENDSGALSAIPLVLDGSRVRVVLEMGATDGASSPCVSCISLRYGLNPLTRLQFLVDLRDGVRLLNGEKFDARVARDYLDEVVMRNAPLWLYRHGHQYKVTVDAAQELPAQPSRNHEFEPQGLYLVRFGVVA